MSNDLQTNLGYFIMTNYDFFFFIVGTKTRTQE